MNRIVSFIYKENIKLFLGGFGEIKRENERKRQETRVNERNTTVHTFAKTYI